MKLRQLAYFAAVVEHGSFSRAAEALYVAQSSLSQAVRNLEQELGFPLLKRSHSGVVPTEMGRLVCRDARRLLEQADAMAGSWKALYRSRAELRGTVRIAAVPGVHPILRHRALPALAETYPNLRCRAAEGRGALLLDYLSSGQTDLILCDYLDSRREETEALAAREGLRLIPLRGDEYRIAAGTARELSPSGDLSAAQAAGLPLACYSGGDDPAELFFGRYFDRSLSEEYTSMDKMIDAALTGPAVSVLPRLTVRGSLECMGKSADSLAFMTVEGFSVPFTHFAGVRQGEETAGALAAALEVIRTVFDGLH